MNIVFIGLGNRWKSNRIKGRDERAECVWDLTKINHYWRDTTLDSLVSRLYENTHIPWQRSLVIFRRLKLKRTEVLFQVTDEWWNICISRYLCCRLDHSDGWLGMRDFALYVSGVRNLTLLTTSPLIDVLETNGFEDVTHFTKIFG